MPRRELLTSSERDQLLSLPHDDGALLRVATLTREDRAFIGQHRGNHNRLGVGIQLCYLRHLGRVLGPDEAPDAQLLGLVATQLKVPPGVWDLYADRHRVALCPDWRLLSQSAAATAPRRLSCGWRSAGGVYARFCR